jgi:guanidinobutyrase / D-arginase
MGEGNNDDGGAIRGPVDAFTVPRFAGISTFARLPLIDEVGHAGVGVVGVPFDSGVTYRPGARFGPAAIRSGSRLLRPFDPHTGRFPFAATQVADAGDVACTPFSPEDAVEQIERGMRGILERADRIVVLGGDHTIALPVLRCLRDLAGEPVGLIHFDAHLDTWDTYFGASYTHGTPFRRATEEGLLRADATAHVGIRGPLYGAEDLTDDASMGFRILSTPLIARIGPEEAAARLRTIVGDAPVYVSIDVDVMDPAFAPGTGTPEPGGLQTREVLAILRALDGLNLIGADVVEVSPPFDHAEITSLAAANLAYELIGRLGGEGEGPAYDH